MKKFNRLFSNPYIIISAVYFLAHFFLLIMSGCWWDDLTFTTHNLGYINAVASQSGRPEWNILMPLCWSLPNNGRYLIFFLYYADALLMYGILRNSGFLSKEESLLITILFTVIPVNDARLLISNFPYTVGLFVFFLTTYLFIKWIKSEKRVLQRILLLAMFFVSFILNSLMAFYYVIVLYLFVVEYKKQDESNIIRKIIQSIKDVIIHYVDFCVIPFLYFIINKTFFPTNGIIFGTYNQITIKTLIDTILYLPISVFKSISDVLVMMFSNLNWFVLSIGILLAILVLYVYNNNKDKAIYNKHTYINLLVFGLISLSLALFPYVAIRSGTIEISGVQGRDAILIPSGVSMILFSVLSLFGDRQRKLSVVLLVVLGVFACNNLYNEWQKDYYYQLSMESLLDNEIIKNNDTFFLADLNESDIKGQRYYSLNANAYHIYKDQTRLFIPKVSNLKLLENEQSLKIAIEALDYAYMMKDYKPEDYNLDAIIVYECELSDFETLKMKYYELFDNDKFAESVNSKGTMSVIEVDDSFTKKLINEYNENRIKTDEDVLLLLVEYIGGE